MYFIFLYSGLSVVEETANPMTTPAKRSVKFSAEEGRPDLASPQQRRVMEEMLERLVGSVIRQSFI